MLIGTVATLVGVAGLTYGAIVLFGAAENAQQEPAPSIAFSFAVFAGSTVKNAGLSVINGDVGGAKTGNAITGFPPGVVNGTQHPGDAIALQAQADLTTAYFDAANRIPGSTLPQEIGGLTLGPGVYEQATDLAVTGTLTLDGQNEPNALFIFQTATLVTAAASVVTLVNGAQACNVFWQVGSAATLGPNTSFVGSIMAASSITLQTGAIVDGRVLARNGEVTLDTNTVTQPTCAGSPGSAIPSTAALPADAGQMVVPTTIAPPVGESIPPGSTSSRVTTPVPGSSTAGGQPLPGPPPPEEPPPVEPPPVEPPPEEPPPEEPPPEEPPPEEPPPEPEPPPVEP